MIPDDVVRAVKCFKRQHPYRGPYGQRMHKFQSVLIVLSRYYSVPVPSLYVYDDSVEPTDFDNILLVNRGKYFPIWRLIALRKFSVISLLHEFRHHLQHILGFPCDNTEDDANVWSHILYKKVWPRNFQRLKERGELNSTSIEI